MTLRIILALVSVLHCSLSSLLSCSSVLRQALPCPSFTQQRGRYSNLFLLSLSPVFFNRTHPVFMSISGILRLNPLSTHPMSSHCSFCGQSPSLSHTQNVSLLLTSTSLFPMSPPHIFLLSVFPFQSIFACMRASM